MARPDFRHGLKAVISHARQQAHDLALRAAILAAQDFPILPTSDTDSTPTLAEEPGDNLSPAQRLAVAALVAGKTFCAAAREANVSRRTLYDWRQDPAFNRVVDKTSRDAMEATTVRIRNLMLRATRVLGDAMLEGGRDGSLSAFRVLNSKNLWSTAIDTAPTAAENAGRRA